MGQLTDADLKHVWREFMEQLSTAHEPFATPLTKHDVREAVDAVDQWVTDNQASFNTAIPQPARGGLTTPQKARLNSLVVLRRFASGV